jgi:hypothetical protein
MIRKVIAEFDPNTGNLYDSKGLLYCIPNDFQFQDLAEHDAATKTPDLTIEKLTAFKALGYKIPDLIKLKEAGVI